MAAAVSARQVAAAVAVAIAAGLAPLAKQQYDERHFRQQFHADLAQLAHEGQKKAATIASEEDRDAFFLWQLDQVAALVQRRQGDAPEQGRRLLDVLGTITRDLRGVITDANTARANRRELTDLAPGTIADDAGYAAAVAKLDFNVNYLKGRDKAIEDLRERHRALIVQSGLDEAGRIELWQAFAGLYDQLLQQVRFDMTKAGQYESIRKYVDWLHENRRRYTVRADGTLVFSDPSAYQFFQSLQSWLKLSLTTDNLYLNRVDPKK